MFTVAEAISMFPTYAWGFDVEPELCGPVNERLMANVYKALPDLPSSATSYSAQSNTRLHEDPQLAEVNEFVVSACDKVCEQLELIYERLLITACWLNISKPGAVHKEHAHPNNYLSAVYYVNVPEGGNSITFSDPRAQAGVMVPRYKKVTPSMANSMSLPAVNGRILIFPSWLRHSVKANKGDDLRVSIAYNLQFDNFADTMTEALFEGDFSFPEE